MKLKIGETVYLQGKDIDLITHLESYSSGLIMLEICETYGEYRYKIEDCYTFCYAFKNPENIEWIMEQEWLTDYANLIELSSSDLDSLYSKCDKELKDYIDYWNNLSHDEKLKTRWEPFKLFVKRYDIISLISAREGEKRFIFPKEYVGKKPYNLC